MICHWKLMVFLGLVLIAGMIAGWITYDKRAWKGQERFTLIKTGVTVSIESFDPVTKKGIKLSLPDNLEVETVNGRGKWLAGALPRLADKYGWEWVGESISDFLGIGFTTVDRRMSWWDRWAWWRNQLQIEWHQADLAGPGLTGEETAADGMKVLNLADAWDDQAKTWFGSLGIMNEGIAVAVVNTTDVPGLGSHAARVINSAGMRVVTVGNDSKLIGRCEIEASEGLRASLSLRFLEQYFKCAGTTFVSDNRDEITVRLGDDYRKKLQL